MQKVVYFVVSSFLMVANHEAAAIKTTGTREINPATLSDPAKKFINLGTDEAVVKAINGKLFPLSADPKKGGEEFLATMIKLIKLGKSEGERTDFFSILLGGAANLAASISFQDAQHRVLTYIFTSVGGLLPEYFNVLNPKTKAVADFIARKIAKSNPAELHPHIRTHWAQLTAYFTNVGIHNILQHARLRAADKADNQYEYSRLTDAQKQGAAIQVIYDDMSEDFDSDHKAHWSHSDLTEDLCLELVQKSKKGLLKADKAATGPAAGPGGLRAAIIARRRGVGRTIITTVEGFAFKYLEEEVDILKINAVGAPVISSVKRKDLFDLTPAGHVVPNDNMFAYAEALLSKKDTVMTARRKGRLVREVRDEIDQLKRDVRERNALVKKLRGLSNGLHAKNRLILSSVANISPGFGGRTLRAGAKRADFDLQKWTYDKTAKTFAVELDAGKPKTEKKRGSTAALKDNRGADITEIVTRDIKAAIASHKAVVATVSEPSLAGSVAYYLYIPAVKAPQGTVSKVAQILIPAEKARWGSEVATAIDRQPNGSILLFFSGRKATEFKNLKAILEQDMHNFFKTR